MNISEKQEEYIKKSYYELYQDQKNSQLPIDQQDYELLMGLVKALQEKPLLVTHVLFAAMVTIANSKQCSYSHDLEDILSSENTANVVGLIHAATHANVGNGMQDYFDALKAGTKN